MSHTGLQLQSDVVGLGESAEEAIRQRWDFSVVMDYIYRGVGCPTPEEPDSPFPTLSAKDLTTTDGKKYSETFLRHIEWADFLEQRKAVLEAEKILVTAEMKEIARGIRINMRKMCKRTNARGAPKPPSSLEMEDEIGEDPRYKELAHKEAFLTSVLTVLEGVVKGRTAYNSLISRQVEIRRQDFENQNRAGNIQGRRGIPNEREPRSRF